MCIRDSLGQVLAADPQAVRNPLDPLPGLAQHPIAALNGAFWEDGAFIYLLPGAVLDHPIHIIFHATGGDTAVYPRLVLTLDDGAQATVVVEYRGQGRYLPVSYTHLGEKVSRFGGAVSG